MKRMECQRCECLKHFSVNHFLKKNITSLPSKLTLKFVLGSQTKKKEVRTESPRAPNYTSTCCRRKVVLPVFFTKYQLSKRNELTRSENMVNSPKVRASDESQPLKLLGYITCLSLQTGIGVRNQ